MSRHPDPPIVTQWRKLIEQGPPKCCATCDKYRSDGICEEFDEAPPIEFAQTPGACESWVREVPF